MSIARIKVVSITSTKTNAGSDFYCNFQVVIDGEIYGSAELAMTGTAGQQKVNIVNLRTPVDISKFSNDVFSFNIDEGGTLMISGCQNPFMCWEHQARRATTPRTGLCWVV